MKTRLNIEQVDAEIAAFDEWLEEQSEPVRDKVRDHLAALTEAIPNLGEKSAKILLAEVYLRVRKVIRLPGPVGADRPLLVIVEDSEDGT